MAMDALTGAPENQRNGELEGLVERLQEPQTAAALHMLLDNIGDTLSEVLEEARAAGRSTGLDPLETSRQLATLIPTLADASPAINRVLQSPIVDPAPIEVLSDTAVALVTGLETAQANQSEAGIRELVRATRDSDTRRGLGFAIEVLRAFGAHLAEQRGETSTEPTN